MSDLRQAAQQALEALEHHVEQTRPIHKTSAAITALRAALAEPVSDTLPPLPEPAGFRTRYRSEPGMIGHYPWTYADQGRRRIDRPECEYENLFTADQMREYADAALAAERERQHEQMRQLMSELIFDEPAALAEPDVPETRFGDMPERLRTYSADAELSDRYSDAMQEAADEIERLGAALAAAVAEPVAWAEQILDDLKALHDSELIQEVDSGDALIRLDDAIAAVEEARDRHAAPPQREPLTEAQADRLYQNIKPSQQQDARSCAAFKRLVRVVEGAHGIAPASAPKEQP